MNGWLLRHAEAVPGTGRIKDRERQLTKAGRETARKLGEVLQARGLHPDHVMTSPARRTVETAELVFPGRELDVREVLYGASPEEVLDEMDTMADGGKALVVAVGHNPTMVTLAATIAGVAKFKPCSLLIGGDSPTILTPPY